VASMMREAALFYRRRGWSVLPISSVSKKPLLDWYEFQTRLPAEQEINAWWTKYPSAGVGIVTGKLSGLVVLDVDPKHGADPNHIYRAYPTTIIARTGGGGGHFYYQHPGGDQYIPNVVGKKNGRPTGYDLRGDGGYVVAPPSLHPSGRRYEWLENAKKPSPVPSKLLAWVVPKQDLNGSATSKEPWLADALRGVGEGARDDTATRLAGYYFSKGIPADVVLQTLKLWNEKNEPEPLPDADIEKVVQSVQRTRARHPASISHRGRDLDDSETDPLRLISLHQYMAQYGESDVAWPVEGWLPDQTIAMMVSPPGTYKTWILIDLAVSVATGTKFLGTAQVLRAGPVLVYQQEDFHGQMAQRIGTIMASRFQIGWDGVVDAKEVNVTMPPSPPIYLHDNRELRFDNKDIMDILEARIAELRPVLVIVDPLYTAAPMDDYMAKAIPHMMRLKRIRDRYGCSFIIAHHTGKRSDKEKLQREDMWGSQFLNAFLETGWQIRPKEKASALIRRHFKVTKDIAEQILTFTIKTDMPTQYQTELGEANITDDLDLRIVNLLNDKGAMTGRAVAKVLKVSNATVSRAMRNLLTNGAVRYGRDNLYRSAEHFDVTEAE